MDPFHSAWHKFDRAYCHAQRLLNQAQQFASSDPQLQPELSYDLVTSELVVKVDSVEQPPVSMALTLGDVLSCCRQALDHVAWDMVGGDSAQLPDEDARAVQFPIVDWPAPADRAKKLQNAMKRRLPGVSQAHRTLVEELHRDQIWQRPKGESPLGFLQALHNADKHRTVQVLASVPSAVTAKGFTFQNCTKTGDPYSVIQPGEPLKAGAELIRVKVDPTGPNPTMQVAEIEVETVAVVDGVQVENLVNAVFESIQIDVLAQVEPAPPDGLECLGYDLSAFSGPGSGGA